MQQGMQGRVLLELENIGCLKRAELDFKPGLNIIKAPNASGKTSLIKGLTSMFSDKIPPAHILALNDLNGRVKLRYGSQIYEKIFRRTPSGSVVAGGSMLPFADHRAFDACVALAETGVVHKITGGEAAFREYLENLSYGKYYSMVISAAQELVNESSRELAGPSFRKFEALPLLLTELTNLHIERDQIEERIEKLKSAHEVEVQSLLKKMEEKVSAFSRAEMGLSELERTLAREQEGEQQLRSFLELADDSAKVATHIKDGIAGSKERQSKIKREIAEQKGLLKSLKNEVETLKKQIEQKRTKEVRGSKELVREINRLNKAVILKEEEIQRAERFPSDDSKYPERLVIEVRKEMMKKIEWLDKVIEHFQDKYMRRMTSARLRFNRNVNKAFDELELKGFEKVFLDQDFALHLVRENSIQQPVETLSASEKLTISLILMLAAKETFLPDFPLFIIDELTLSYDPERFRHIVNYIRRRVPYVIVTSLVSSGVGGLQIAYEA